MNVTKILVLVYNYYESAMSTRARYLFKHFSKDYEIELVYRKSNNLIDTFRFLKKSMGGFHFIYMVDIGFPSLISAVALKIISFGKIKLVVDTGDLVYQLARAVGTYSRFAELLIYLTEKLSLILADIIVVRGSYHKEYLNKKGFQNVNVVLDGVDCNFSKPMDVSQLRERLNLNNFLVVGVMGNLTWVKNYDLCYGWELVEAMKYLKESPIKGIIVGDGSGLPYLKSKAKKYGIYDKIMFMGRIPYHDVPKYINLMDICLLTQPNILLAEIKTTGKLPEYLACGKYIIASKVGEAKRLIRDNGCLLEYDGIKDQTYPEKLAEVIRSCLDHEKELKKGLKGIKIAKTALDYKLLSLNLKKLLKI